MKNQYYRAVSFNNKGTTEAVNYVGVHPLVWHDHPEQPDMGFVEADDEIDALFAEIASLKEQLQNNYLNDTQHVNREFMG